MIETRDFPTAVIASISSGVLLCKFGEMHEAAEYLMGHSIWTHHFGDRTFADEMSKSVLAQCPGMPNQESARDVNGSNYLEFIAKIKSEIGSTVKIKKGGGLTAMLPTDGIPDHLKDRTIAIKT